MKRDDTKLPLFVRNGGLVPLTEALDHAPPPGTILPLEVRHYGNVSGEMRLYDDDGVSFGYERGEFKWIELAFDGETKRGSIYAEGGIGYGPIEWRSMTK